MIKRVLQKFIRIKDIVLGEIERFLFRKIVHIGTPRQALEQWISASDNHPEAKGQILISALRNNTWIEWAAYCAVVARTYGFASKLLYKKSETDRFYRNYSYFNFWKGVSKIAGIQLINIEELPYDIEVYQKYFESFHEGAIAALAYDYHIESADIIDNPTRFNKELNQLKEESARNGARLNKYLKSNIFHQFICYSGIIRDTPMLLQGAKDTAQDLVCVEGWSWRPGHMIYNFNAPSLEYNVEGWMKYFGEWNVQKEKEMGDYLNFLNGFKQDSEWLNNFYMVQRAKVGEDFPVRINNFVQGEEKIFLLACNVIGDSSMLNRETIFRSHRDFIQQTIEYFSQRADLKLIIRIHPGEEWIIDKVKMRLAPIALELSQSFTNILVIDSSEKINTFSLIPFIQTGLVWLTSAGVDMVARGVPVIAAAKPKYHNLGIVEEPKSIAEYFNLIDKHALNNLRPNQDQILKAKEYLYLVFKGFSFEAMGRNFRATTYKFGKMPSQEEHDRFYRIILKLEPSPDQQNFVV